MVTVTVDTTAGSVTEADRFGPKVGGQPALCCIHQINCVNSWNGYATLTMLQFKHHH